MSSRYCETGPQLPDVKIKVMKEIGGVFHTTIGDKIGIYCLPTNSMAVLCPCGVIRPGYPIFEQHILHYSLYLSFKNNLDNDDNDGDDVVESKETDNHKKILLSRVYVFP
jgi:hypothetical protein